MVAYGVEKMSFAQPGSSIEEDRIVVPARVFRRPQSRSVGQAVGAAHDEGIKGVLGVEVGAIPLHLHRRRL